MALPFVVSCHAESNGSSHDAPDIAPLPEAPPPVPCSHPKSATGWCELCNVGFVASIPIPSKMLFETLDAHGHSIDPRSLRCPTCRPAIESGGFCERCRRGFVGGQAYLSRLSYSVAHGEPRAQSMISCAPCRRNSESAGWCDTCEIGLIGSAELVGAIRSGRADGALAFRSREEFRAARLAFDRLGRALETLDRCETCAVALFTRGWCVKCDRSYAEPASRGE